MKTLFAFAALATLAARADIAIRNGETIAFTGDSITERGNKPVGYVNLFMKGLEISGVKGVKKIALGVSGSRSDSLIGRLDKDVLARKDKVLPQWMTFSCGVNDVWHGKTGVLFASYTNYVTRIFDRTDAAGVKVIVLTPTMIGEDPANENNAKLSSYVAWIKAEAARRRYLCADLNAAMHAALAAAPKPERGYVLTCDGVHMAYEGDKMMAWGLLETVGVPAEKKAEIVAAWDRMPGYHVASVPLNKLETDALRQRLADEKVDESAYLKRRLGLSEK